jgi:protein transport protein SEC13
VLEFQDGSWGQVVLNGAHGLGVNGVSWAPSARPGSLVSTNPEKGAMRRFVSGGSDCLLKIWDWRYVMAHFLLPLAFITLLH